MLNFRCILTTASSILHVESIKCNTLYIFTYNFWYTNFAELMLVLFSQCLGISLIPIRPLLSIIIQTALIDPCHCALFLGLHFTSWYHCLFYLTTSYYCLTYILYHTTELYLYILPLSYILLQLPRYTHYNIHINTYFDTDHEATTTIYIKLT